MAIDAGDVVITFLGDTTQLDQTFQRVTANVETTNTQAALSTVELKQAQSELRTALAAVTAEGGNTVTNLQALAEAEARVTVAAAAAKEEHAALKQELIGAGQGTTLMAEAATSAAVGLGEMLAAFVAVEAVKGFVEGVQKSVLELQLLSEKTGVNITTLAGLEHVAKESGVGFDGVSSAMTRLSRAQALVIEGGTGSKALATSFQSIGISAQEVKSMSLEDLWFRVADALANAATHGQANAAMFRLMGRGASALLPIFEDTKGKLRELTEEAGKASGINEEAGRSAKDWEKATADLSEAFRAGAIPAMQLMAPALRGIVTAGDAVFTGLKELGALVGGLGLEIFEFAKGTGTVLGDLVNRDFVKLVADTKVAGSAMSESWRKTNAIIEMEAQQSRDFLNTLWTPTAIAKPHKDANDRIVGAGAEKTSELIKQAEAESQAEIALIKRTQAENQLAFDQKKISIKQWAEVEADALFSIMGAHENYLARVTQIERAGGDAAKIRIAGQKLSAQMDLDAAEAAKKLGEETVKGEQESDKFKKLSLETIKNETKELAKMTDAATDLSKHDPFQQWQKDALNLENEMKKLGVQGFLTLQQKVDAAQKAEAHLNAAGIKDGKIWLEVQQAKLKAIIALEQSEGKSTKQTIHDLDQIEAKLKVFDVGMKTTQIAVQQVFQQMQQDAKTFAIDLGDAMAQAVQGTISAAQAIEQATGKLIGGIAKQWAEYYAAQAIADLFWNPARAAAELGAAAALAALGSLASSWGSGSGSKTSTSGASGSSKATATAGTTPAGPTGGTQNVVMLAGGALVTQPTLAMIAEKPGSREGVIPLDDPSALRAIARAMGGDGGISNHFAIGGMISTSDLSKLARTITRGAATGRLRVTVANSNRVTRRS